MRQKVTIAFLLVTVLHVLAVCKVPAERASIEFTPTIVRTPDGFLEHFEQSVKDLMYQSGTPGAAIAIVKENKVVFLSGFGEKELGTGDSVDVNTVFRLASVSKGFTGVLAGILDYREQLSIDDPLQNRLPEFDLASEWHEDSLTIKNVLSHTTGLPYHAYTNLVEEGWSRSQLLNELAGINFAGKAGEFYSYQNVSYCWYEEVVEQNEGKAFAEVMQERLFEPLGMETASMTHEAYTSNENTARPHLRLRRGWRPIRVSKDYYNVASAGGINASIKDMSEYLLALMGNRPDVLPEQVLNAVFEPVIPTYVKRKYFSRWKNVKDVSYGLGWRILKKGEDDIVYHGGYVNGFRSEILINRSENIGICVLVNAPSTFSYKVIPTFLDLYDQYRQEEVQLVSNDLIGPVSDPI